MNNSLDGIFGGSNVGRRRIAGFANSEFPDLVILFCPRQGGGTHNNNVLLGVGPENVLRDLGRWDFSRAKNTVPKLSVTHFGYIQAIAGANDNFDVLLGQPWLPETFRESVRLLTLG